MEKTRIQEDLATLQKIMGIEYQYDEGEDSYNPIEGSNSFGFCYQNGDYEFFTGGYASSWYATLEEAAKRALLFLCPNCKGDDYEFQELVVRAYSVEFREESFQYYDGENFSAENRHEWGFIKHPSREILVCHDCDHVWDPPKGVITKPMNFGSNKTSSESLSEGGGKKSC